MPYKLYKVQNEQGDVQEVYEDRLEEAKKDGYLPAVTDGETVLRTTLDKIPEAEKDGFVPLKSVADYVEENKGLKGTAKVGLGQFVDEALFGVPEIIAENTETAEEKAKRKAIKSEHGIANTIGGIGGFAASTLVGGPLAKTATTVGKAASRVAGGAIGDLVSNRLIRTAAEKGIQYGTEGAIFTAPTALAEAVTGNPEQAVERIIAGGLGNALLGPVLEQGGRLIRQTVGKKLSNIQESLGETAEKFAAKEYGLERATSKKLGPTKIKKIGRQLLDAGEVKVGKNTETMISENQLLQNKLASERDILYNLIDAEKASTFQPEKLINKIEESLGKFNRESPLLRPEANKLNDILEAIAQRRPNDKGYISLKEAQNLVEELGNINWDATSTKKSHQIAKRAYGMAREELNNVVNKVFKEYKPELVGKVNTLNQKMATAFDTAKLLKNKYARETGNKFYSLTDTIAGAGAVASGSPQGLAFLGAKKLFDNYGNPSIALLADSASKMIQNLQKSEVLSSKLPNLMGTVTTRLRPTTINKLAGLNIEQIQNIEQELTQIEQNPEQFTDLILPETEVLTQIDPKAASLMNQKLVEVSQYIKNALPKNPNPVSTPFRKVPWKPTSLEVSKFNRISRAALNPMSVIENLADGFLSHDEIKTVKDLYPELSKDMDMALMDYLEKNPNMSYAKKQQIQIFLQTDYLSEYQPKNMQQLQKNVRQNPEQNLSESQPTTTKPVQVPNLQPGLSKALNQE